MRLFFDANIESEATQHILSEEESKHACKVLRMQVGDALALVNGKGYYFETEIIDAHPKRCIVKITNEIKEDEPSYDIHVAIAPTKMNDRMEWFMEKVTELGITEITLVLTKNSERKDVKIERFEKILISAMKQSKRLYLPKLNPLMKVSEFITKHPNGLIAECYEGEKSTIGNEFKLKSCPILIGPEGDFTQEEVEFAHSNGYKSISLGKNRLRTETAGLYAVMAMTLTI